MPGNDASLSFDELLAISDLPPPGPEHYLARRRLWLTPKPNLHRKNRELHPQLKALKEQLDRPDAIEDDRIWQNGPQRIWKNLAAGGSLKKPMPLSLLMKIIHMAWVRDSTWPAGAVAPEPDDVLPDIPSVTHVKSPEATSGATSPWLVPQNNHNQLSLDQIARDF